MQESCLNELFNTISEEKILLNEPMKNHTSIKIGGPAEIFVKASSVDDVKATICIANKYNIPLHIIGNGSNLLVQDAGIKGIVLKIEMKNLTINKNENYVEVVAQSGALISAIGYELMQNEITGFEELSGIPGTVGGAIKMNAGAHGKEMKDVVLTTTYIDTNAKIKTITNEEHQFEYRNSIFSQNNFIILETTLKLNYGEKDKIKEKMNQYFAWRKENQPLEYPNAGSTFKRGEEFVTAKIIDECGLKGYSIGGAQVSTKHAGFIVNTGNATAKDVLELTKHVKEQVYKKTGKTIELEIQIM